MYVNFEFLGDEAIENVITCMNFRMDKVVFWGYDDVIQRQRKRTEKFLKKYCHVKKVFFLPLIRNDFQGALHIMRQEIKKELEEKNQIFFDITGGESMILVAFGMLAEEFEAPVHLYDIEKNKLVEMEEGVKKYISSEAEPQNVELNLERYIEMYGGVINYALHKEIKGDTNAEFQNDIMNIWQVARKYDEYWNPFSDFCRKYFQMDTNLRVISNQCEIMEALNKNNSCLKKKVQLDAILDDLHKAGALLDMEQSAGRYSFRFKNKNIQSCIWEGGSVLELYTFNLYKDESDDCKMGVHIDWDGVIHEQKGIDVLNEIDVLTLNGNIPTFISCKSGKMGASQSLHALYELETVADRFGGHYAKKVLVTTKKLADVYLNRAKEMDIEIRCIR